MFIKKLPLLLAIVVCAGSVSAEEIDMAVAESGPQKVKLSVPIIDEKGANTERVTQEVTFSYPHIKSQVHYEGSRPVVIINSFIGGGLEWAFAPGASDVAYSNMHTALKSIGDKGKLRGKKVGVLGAGANALMIADRLGQEGARVTVYAENFEQEKGYQYKPTLWPYHGMNQSEHAGLLENLQKQSFKAYMKWAKNESSAYSAVKLTDAYIFDDKENFRWMEENGLVTKAQPVEVEFVKGNTYRGHYYQMFNVDTQKLREQLISSGRGRSVKYVEKKVAGIEDILDTRADIVFNCIGVDPFKTVKSESMNSGHGRIVSIHCEAQMDYIMYINSDDGTYTYCIPNPRGEGFELVLLSEGDERWLPYSEGIAMRFNEFTGREVIEEAESEKEPPSLPEPA